MLARCGLSPSPARSLGSTGSTTAQAACTLLSTLLSTSLASTPLFSATGRWGAGTSFEIGMLNVEIQKKKRVKLFNRSAVLMFKLTRFNFPKGAKCQASWVGLQAASNRSGTTEAHRGQRRQERLRLRRLPLAGLEVRARCPPWTSVLRVSDFALPNFFIFIYLLLCLYRILR